MSMPSAVVMLGTGDVTCLVETATIRHGRDDPTSQPEASAATFQIFGPLPAGVDIGSAASIYAVFGGVSYPRFVGEITDIEIGWVSTDSPACRIIAVGALARMGYRFAGTAAYPSESDGARANRVIVAAAVATDVARTDPGTVNVTTRPADPQPALQIAHDAAEDGDGYLWQSKDGKVLYADADHRRGVGVGLGLDCHTIPLEVIWTKSLDGLINDMRVTWGNGTGGGGDGGGTEPPVSVVVGGYGPLPATIEIGAPPYVAAAYERVRLSAAVDVTGLTVGLGSGAPDPIWKASIRRESDGVVVASGAPTLINAANQLLPVTGHLLAAVDYLVVVERGPGSPLDGNDLVRLGMRPTPFAKTGVFVTPAAGDELVLDVTPRVGYQLTFNLVGVIT